MENFSLSDRINEFKNAGSYRLLSGLPVIASISVKTKHPYTAAEKAAKVTRATTVLIHGNKFDLIIPPSTRWADMIGEGYVSRIASIIGSSIADGEVLVDLWSVPNEKEVDKFYRFRSDASPIVFRRTEVQAPLKPEEIELLPPKHAARTNKNLLIQKTVYKVGEPVDLLSTIKEIFDEKTQQLVRIDKGNK